MPGELSEQGGNTIAAAPSERERRNPFSDRSTKRFTGMAQTGMRLIPSEALEHTNSAVANYELDCAGVLRIRGDPRLRQATMLKDIVGKLTKGSCEPLGELLCEPAAFCSLLKSEEPADPERVIRNQVVPPDWKDAKRRTLPPTEGFTVIERMANPSGHVAIRQH
jgi:hypothetical protein